MLNKIKFFLREYNKLVNRIVNNLLNKIFTKKTKKIIIRYIKTFKYFILGFLLLLIVIKLKFTYNNNYKRDNIEGIVAGSVYVGNAIAVNKTAFLTTYDSIKEKCKVENNRKIKYYLIKNGQIFEVELSFYDEYKNLAILTSRNRIGDFYAIFANNNATPKQDIFISKTNNSLNYKFYLHELRNNGVVDFIKVLDFPRNYNGEVLINKNFEIVGIANNEKTGFLNKKIYIINNNIIKQFFRENGIIYATNHSSSNLTLINNYLANINYKLVCKEELTRSPLIFERKR